MNNNNIRRIASTRSIRNHPYSNRSASYFAVTIPFTNVQKDLAFYCLEGVCEQLVISQEYHQNGLIHHHLFLKTVKRFTRDDIKQLIELIYDLNEPHQNEKIYVNTVRNVKNYLAYITKEDDQPLFKGFNIENRLSFYFRTIKWAKSVNEYDVSDPFILSHPQYYKLLKEVFIKIKEKTRKSNFKLKRLRSIQFAQNKNPNWKEKVLNWWNDWAEKGYKHKKKQLYLYGPSNTGKTTFINDLLRNGIIHNKEENELDESEIEIQIYRPTPSEPKYAWQSFDKSRYNIMVIDEFYIDEYNIADMKRALAGEVFVSNTKFGESKNIQLQIPSILISNLAPPPTNNNQTSNKYQGFSERLEIINANEQLF